MIMRFLESGLDVKSITVMVQKEVADRFIATVGSKEYAAVSLAVQMRGEARVTRIVGRQMFFPMPNVDSAVVKIDVDKNKLHGVDLSALSRLVRISFAMRRKMLTNNLMSGYGLSREKAIDVLLKADISPTVRGEALSIDQYVKVLNVLKDFGTK